MFDGVQDYLDNHFQNVKGWCVRNIFQTVAACREHQQRLGLLAPVAEIGVYHGKFFIGLALVSNADRGHWAIDVFDLQQFNLDRAGSGDLQAFRRNMQIMGFNEDQYTAYRADSMTIARRELNNLMAVGPFSFFSVDGCHMAEHTINDIRIACELTDPRGIILVDDYYNADWPGVQEGVAKLYLNDAPRFVPLVYTSNKLFLCHLSHHSSYLDFLRRYLSDRFPDTRLKDVRRFGYETLNVATDTSKPLRLTPHQMGSSR